MNILFLYTRAIDPIEGGVQRVTKVLADYFENKGNSIYYLSLYHGSNHIDKHRQLFLPDSVHFITINNINFFIQTLIDKRIDIVINQGGTDPQCSLLAYHCKETQAKLISVLHNSPLASINNFSSSYSVAWRKKGISFLLPLTNIKYVKLVILQLYKYKYKKHYSDLYINSNKVFLLSDNFKDEFNFFITQNRSNNIIGMPNPTSFISAKKTTGKKELLYVGRIDTSQKRVDLLLEIWGKVHIACPDWNLVIVGGGDELNDIIHKSSRMNLNNIHFEGFQDPQKYYEQASILCMTSSYEGFSMVLIEAMGFGVIPFAFNSFSSITDIISHNKNGILINPFEIDTYAKRLIDTMKNKTLRDKLSADAIQKCKEFSIEVIGKRWMEIINNL